MAMSTYADVQAFINTVYQDALTVARDQMFMDRLVTPFTDQSGLAPRTVTEYGSLSVNTIGEADDLVGQSFTRSTLSTLTPAEYGGQVFLSDSRLESDPEGVRQDATLELGMALATDIETNLVGNFSSLTGGTVGAAGSTMTWAYFFNALSVLRAQLAPRPYYCVLHPYQWNDLGQAVTPAAASVTNAPEFQDAVMREFWVGRVSGVDIFTSTNLSIDASDDTTGGMFSRPALAYDLRRAPRLEPERDASRRGWELNLTAIYAHGTWRPTYGVQIVSDASTPS